ncbi:MAG: aspartate/tyrosine/aromatic aminotransferase [Candidatus Hydrogenedentes bacterium]|jgi:aspartate/tyrosine/aromatic aminotransferase|nr:aspartate/tyrosine/aromatic aminotransferase [Candidatus Hydrogenedentota bacterium]
MFETIQMEPPDSILGLTEAFQKELNPQKINLGVGIYKDEHGETPTLNSVKQAETQLLAANLPKNYFPIAGVPAFGNIVQQLVFSKEHPAIMQNRCRTAHTPGGTGALRVAADFLFRCFGAATVWMSTPTWANHPGIFAAAGHHVRYYPYYVDETKDIDFQRMQESLKEAKRGDVLLLHACCHNPCGVDLTLAHWAILAEMIKDRGLIAVADFAYQGFGDGLHEDAAGLRLLAEHVDELLVCSSFSKNFGLYQDRCGALTLTAGAAESTARAFSQVEKVIRSNYSNPPAHGALIVKTIMENIELRQLWEKEVTVMRNRINGIRALFVDTLKEVGVDQDFSFIKEQRGMFSFSGLSREQVSLLREKYAIYIVDNGRINVAGITEDNVKPLCLAIADVLKFPS